jgi:hypothetical protein
MGNAITPPGDIRPRGKGPGDWRHAFLSALAKSGSDIFAADAAGKSIATARRHRRKFPVFRARWDEALERHVQRYEIEVADRALNRKDPMSGTLLMFKVKGERPEKWREFWKDPADQAALPVAAVVQLFEKYVDAAQAPAFLAEVKALVDQAQAKGKK